MGAGIRPCPHDRARTTQSVPNHRCPRARLIGEFLAALRARDVEMVEYPHGQVRAVTHYGVTSADIETTIDATRAALAETSRTGVPAGSVSASA